MEEKEAIKGKVHELSDLWNKLFENEVELVKIDPEQSVMRSLLTFKYERKDTYYKMFDGEFYINVMIWLYIYIYIVSINIIENGESDKGE